MIKAAIVGAGYIAQAHANAIKNNEDAMISAIVDIAEEKGRKMADSFNCSYYKSLDELFKNEEIDCVIVCVPTPFHPEIVIKAANAKKHILCEKPMALSLEEIDKMIKAVKDNDVKAMTGQILRFWPEYIKIKSILDSKVLGNPIHIFCQRLAVTPDWQDDKWGLNEKLSGGAPLDLHIHDLDFLLWVLGRPQYVKAQGTFNPDEGGLSHIFTTLGFKSGQAGFAEGGWAFKGSFPFTMSLRILCEKGTIEWIFKAGKNIEERSKQAEITIYKNNGEIETVETVQRDAFFNEMDYFISCIKNNNKIENASFEDGRAAVELSLAAIKSAKENSVVNI